MTHSFSWACLFSVGKDDLVKVLDELSDVNSIWKELGLALGLKPGKLDDIESDEAKQSGRMMATIKLWLKGGEATWQDLITALSSPRVDENALAKTIKKKFSS